MRKTYPMFDQPSNQLSFHIITQGCKINQYESQALAESWLAQGGREASCLEQADLIVLNSCAVTDKALQDLRKTIHRCQRVNPSARLVVTGCAAQMCTRDMGELTGVDRVIPQEEKPSLTLWPPKKWPASRLTSSPNPAKRFPGFWISRYPRARPGIKVQDGCSQACTYCIVPLTRGPARSRNPQEVVEEAVRLLANGYRELIVSGINLAQYRYQGMDFWDLVQYLHTQLAPDWQGAARLRLSSLDPSQLNPKALAVLAESRMLCPHLHVSMQSASHRVLQAMGRTHYDPDRVADFFRQLAGIWPCFALSGDFLVGFPGETENDMQVTEDWFAAQPFTNAHIFAYSPRPGTQAAEAKNHVQAEVKKERSKRLREMAAAKAERFAHQLLELPSLGVVLEETDPGRGRSEYYVPCIFAPRCKTRIKDLVPAVPVQAEGSVLVVRTKGVEAG
jgi:MiaB/RimO family radical SAM methylthiotransferase